MLFPETKGGWGGGGGGAHGRNAFRQQNIPSSSCLYVLMNGAVQFSSPLAAALFIHKATSGGRYGIELMQPPLF